MLERSTLQVIIPALNEEATIADVVAGLRELGLERIRVVDNGSTDATVARAREAGAEVVVEARRGYGQACWTGTADLPSDVEWILFCDADGSDDLLDVERLIAEARAGADFVLGDRRARAEARAVMTPVQNFGNALSVALIRLGWGHQYRDLGPLRLVRRTLYDAIGMRDRGFGWTIEMQVRAVEVGARIVELPVGYRRRQGGRSKISGTIKGSVQAGTIILSTIATLAWRRVSPALRWAGALVLLGALFMWPHGAATAANVPWLLAAAAIMGAGFVLTWGAAQRRDETGAPGWWFWGVAVAARLLLLPMEPGDDVWRYLWEGRVQLAGYSPFHYAPLAPELGGLRTEWWGLINHPDKTAIYPPLLQLGFRGMAAGLGDAVWAWKLVFIAADLAVCGLLAGRLGAARALLFAWNPLVLYATAGGAHFESLLLLPLVLAWRAWEAGGYWRAALAVGVSIGVKWITAPLLCWLAWQERRRPLRAAGLVGLGMLPLGLALLWFRGEFGPLGNLWPGEFVAKARGMDFLPWLVDLVRRPAEITNAWIPWMFLPLAGAVLLLARRATTAFEGYFTVLLLCLPSVHPWYFVWLAPWAAITGNLGTRLLSLSGFVYFWVWRTHELTGMWETALTERMLIWLPFVVGWACWKWRENTSNTSDRSIL
ncbi:MAG: glycosyltransferase family 2 protein [Candidatus Didemnitutus sp.]|nr:glycosyltransferase family 2 protein [Candidatus Didemnitutus sp.]